MIPNNVSIAGWGAILARFATLIRPRVETLEVVLRDLGIDLVGVGTTAKIELDMAHSLPTAERHRYMVAGARMGSGGMPPSIATCQIHGLEIVEIGRIGALAMMVLGDLRVYVDARVPCRCCDGGKRRGRDMCVRCKDSAVEPDPDAVPFCRLPGWMERGGEDA